MLRIHPFRALRPTADLAAKIPSVPYDVVNREEAKELATGNQYSFLHVVRPEIDLPDEVTPYDDRVYAKARENFQRMINSGWLIREESEALYLYRQIMNGRAQVGLVCCCHVDDYERDLIKKHEKTRKAKEDDRTRHVLTINANAGPVFLTYRGSDSIDDLVDQEMAGASLYDFHAVDGVRHTVWRVTNTEAMLNAFRNVPHAYVADGHHRAASAWRAGKEQRATNSHHTGEEEYNWFLTCLFPSDQLNILPYNRVIRDLSGMSSAELTSRLESLGELVKTDDPNPGQSGSFAFYYDRTWRLLTLPNDSIDPADPIESLDVALLESRVLRPLFGIEDVRTDERIDFVGGIRGTQELERLVDSGDWACAVSMHATTIEQLMGVADANRIMPPKSTWFEPKLRSGLLVHTLD